MIPPPDKIHPLPFWNLEESEREELVSEMERVLIQKQVGRYPRELLRLTLEKQAKFVPWEMRNGTVAERTNTMLSKLYPTEGRRASTESKSISRHKETRSIRRLEVRYICPKCLRLVNDLEEHSKIHSKEAVVKARQVTVETTYREPTEEEIQNLMERVQKFASASTECNHSMISLGFKSSFSEGASSVVLQCWKCRKRIQENL